MPQAPPTWLRDGILWERKVEGPPVEPPQAQPTAGQRVNQRDHDDGEQVVAYTPERLVTRLP